MIYGKIYENIDQPFICIPVQATLDESDIEVPCGKKSLYFYAGYSTRHDKSPRIKMNTAPIKRNNPRAGVFIYRDKGITIMEGNDYNKLRQYEVVGKSFYDYYFNVFDYSFRYSNELNSTEVVDIISADVLKRIKSDISELVGREPLLYDPNTKTIMSSDEAREMERLSNRKYWEQQNLKYSGLL